MVISKLQKYYIFFQKYSDYFQRYINFDIILLLLISYLIITFIFYVQKKYVHHILYDRWLTKCENKTKKPFKYDDINGICEYTNNIWKNKISNLESDYDVKISNLVSHNKEKTLQFEKSILDKDAIIKKLSIQILENKSNNALIINNLYKQIGKYKKLSIEKEEKIQNLKINLGCPLFDVKTDNYLYQYFDVYWKDYENDINIMLNNNKKFIEINGKNYEINFMDMTQTNISTKYSRKIRKIKLSNKYTLFTECKYYDQHELYSLIKNNSLNIIIKRIINVENRIQQKMYNFYKDNYGKNNEKILFHGTHTISPFQILSCDNNIGFTGLNCNYSNNDNFFGKGVYFTENINYIHDCYSHHVNNDLYQIIAARVELGNCEKMEHINKNAVQKYGFNSRSGICPNTKCEMFIVSENIQILPICIIEYEIKEIIQ